MLKKIFLISLLTPNLFAETRTSSDIQGHHKLFFAETIKRENKAEIFQTVMKEVKSCGFSFNGPNCLDSSFAKGSVILEDYKDQEISQSFSLVYNLYSKQHLFFTTEINKDLNKKFLRTAKFYLAVTGKSLREHLELYKQGELEEGVTIETPKSTFSYAQKKLNNPCNNKDLYHGAQFLLKTNHVATKPEIQALFLKHRQILFCKSSENYQFKTLELVRHYFSDVPQFKREIACSLAPSSHPSIQQFSAITLAELDEKSDAIKQAVKRSMTSPKAFLRKLGILAFARIQKGINDENFALSKLNDNSIDIRQAVITLSQNYDLSNSHLETLSELVKDYRWEIRKSALKFIAKIKTQESTTILLKSLIDSDLEIRQFVCSEILTRSISDQNLPQLEDILKNSCSSIRKLALNILGKIKSLKALNLLILTTNDTDSEIRILAKKWARNSQPSNRNLQAIAMIAKSTSKETRIFAIEFLDKINSSKSLAILASMLSDSKNDVSKEAFSALKSKKLDRSLVKFLEATLQRQNSSTYYPVVTLLGQIKSDLSRFLLIKILTHTKKEIRENAKCQLESLGVNKACIKSLALVMKNEQWQSRQLAAKLLSQIKWRKSFDLLVDCLLVEKDRLIKDEIENSLRKLRTGNLY